MARRRRVYVSDKKGAERIIIAIPGALAALLKSLLSRK
jgi:hypothetical protein